MNSYKKPMIIESNEKCENIQLNIGEDCPGGYSSLCDAFWSDFMYHCNKHTPCKTKDDCPYFKNWKCTYDWSK